MSGSSRLDSKQAELNIELHSAIIRGDLKDVIEALDNKAEVNGFEEEEGKGMTPLGLACEKRNDHIVEELLERKASINLQDEKGNTPLHYSSDDLRYIEFLIMKNAVVDSKNKNGETPLMWAVSSLKAECVKSLLENKADPTLTNKNDNSASDFLSTQKTSSNGKIILDLIQKAVEEKKRTQEENKEAQPSRPGSPRPG